MPEDMPHKEPSTEHVLDELEAANMQIIWRQGEATVREVLETRQPAQPLTSTTVMTATTRLTP